MPAPRQAPPSFVFETPRHFYVFRRWFDDPVDRTSTAAEVIVISHNGPLEGHELRERLESLERGPASDFVMIDIAPHSGVVLDTWERGIEGYSEDHQSPCRCYRNWWDADECTEVVEGMEPQATPEADTRKHAVQPTLATELLTELITCRHDLARMLGELRQSVTVPETDVIPDEDDDALCEFEESRIARLDALIARARGQV